MKRKRLNKKQLQAYSCILCSAIEREITEPSNDYRELQKEIRQIKEIMVNVGLEAIPYGDWMLEAFPPEEDVL